MDNNTINICLAGCVSTGKSTILNAFFGSTLAQCKIKRTTMMPNIFTETVSFQGEKKNNFQCVNSIINTMIPNIFSEQKNDNFNFDYINKRISEMNEKIIEHTEKGNTLSLDNFGGELCFDVPPMNMNLHTKLRISIYDIPGLNDARTKKTYYDYLEKNFHKFNIILFVVDIHSGLNTSDEMDILKFLAKNIKKHQRESKKNIKMLTVINKADDMTLSETGELNVEGELGEMFEQTRKTIQDVFLKEGINDNLFKCIPICANSAHLYRMIQKNPNIEELLPEQILKIGIDEKGTKFRRYTATQQKELVQQKILDENFVSEQIKLSGFSAIEEFLSDKIEKNGSDMIIENIVWNIDRCQPIDLDNFIQTLKPIVDLLKNMIKYDVTQFRTILKYVINNIIDLINKKIQKMSDVEQIYSYYLDICSKIDSDLILKSILSMGWDYYLIPPYIKDKILEIIQKSWSEKGVLLKDFKYFDILESMDCLNLRTIELLIVALMSNQRGINTIQLGTIEMNSNNIKNNIIKIFEKIKISPYFIEFLRFFLMNVYTQNVYTPPEMEYLYCSKMILEQYNEIPMCEFLNWTISSRYVDESTKSQQIRHHPHPRGQNIPLVKKEQKINHMIFLKDINKDSQLLELYYISKCQELKIDCFRKSDTIDPSLFF